MAAANPLQVRSESALRTAVDLIAENRALRWEMMRLREELIVGRELLASMMQISRDRIANARKAGV